ncbi:c-type cytochrome [Litoreibacter albidus]|uniref:Cytochrome c n=1 Tax=Litoreibacter albidus TaxID=670155 RepID=A0A1H2UXP2_9RHOB|nr:c-type cytochrome [Litoreibacter albidus]SDW60852.1 cytochrome c [Litoreibacter albidus]
MRAASTASLVAAAWLAAGAVGAAEGGDASVFARCAGCHEVGPAAKDRIGPHLNGLFGRRAGAHAGFAYSESMQRAGNDGLIWTAATLDAYIENPRALVSKTRMSFRGLASAQDRADLLAYLRRFSDDPSDLPEAEPTARGVDHDIDPSILALRGDPEYGEYLSAECVTCHRVDGGDTGIPSITRWPTEDFVVAMQAYKRALRPHPVMQMLAGRLSDEEIAALAAYFHEIK